MWMWIVFGVLLRWDGFKDGYGVWVFDAEAITSVVVVCVH